MQLAQQQRLTLPVQAGATVAASRRQRLPRSWQPAPAAAAAPYAGPHSSSPWSPQAQAQARQSLRRGRSTRPASAVEQQAETAERAAEQPTAAAPAEEQAQQRQGVAFTTTTVGDDTRMSKAERATLYKLSKPVSEFGFSRVFEEKYELGEKIGKGASCTVYAATCRSTGEEVAVKVMPKRVGPDGFLERTFARRVLNEVEIATHLGQSLNVCYFHGAFETDAAVQLVLEQLSGGQLWDRVTRGSYSERDAARIVRDVVRTIAQCHSKNIMMRDIKPQNFMFATPAEDAPLKAVDFGISVFCRPGEVITSRAGTRIVMAPEVVNERYALSADLWSAGIMAYLLLTGRLPYPFWDRIYVQRQKVTEKEMFVDICEAPLDFTSPPWDTLSEDAADFVSSLLNRKAHRRPTAEEALQHRWLQPDALRSISGGGSGADVPLSNTIVQRLQRFGTFGRLKRAALRTVATQVPQDSILVSELRGLFLELDPLDRGRVPYTRLQQELEEGIFDLTPQECSQLLAQMEMTPDGEITFAEFLASLIDWSQVQESGQWEALVDRAFQAMDSNACGRISPADLEALLCGDEGCEAADWLDSALREADIASEEQGVGLADFRRLMNTQIQNKLHLFSDRVLLGAAAAGGAGGGADTDSDEAES